MFLPSFRKRLAKTRKTPDRKLFGQRRFRPRLEALEDRTLLAASITWTSTVSGDWSNAANWTDSSSVHRLPKSTDDVLINQPGVTVTHSTGTDAVHSLTANDAFVLSGGTLTVAAALQEQNSNTFTLSGGTLSGATIAAGTTITGTSSGGTLDGVTANGNLDLTQGSNISATILDSLTLNGMASLGGAISTSGNYGRLFFQGAQTLGGTGSVVFGLGFNSSANALFLENGTLTIAAGMTVHGAAGQISNLSGTTALINQGTISADGGGTIILNPTSLTNKSQLQASNAFSSRVSIITGPTM